MPQFIYSTPFLSTSILASAIFKADHSILCARTYIPAPKNFVNSLIDTSNKQIQQYGTNQGTITVDDHFIVFTKVQEQLILLIANEDANLQDVNALLELLSSSLENVSDPFEAINLLDELCASGVANQYLITNRNIKQRIEMYSEAEKKYIEEQKRLQEEANKIRQQKAQELQEKLGDSGLLQKGLHLIGIGKAKTLEDLHGHHGLAEDDFEKLRRAAQQGQEQQPEPEEKQKEQESESDEDFKIKQKQVVEEEAPQRQRKGRGLVSKKVTRMQ